MSWLDNYRQGSFRGVEFRLRAHTLEGGRRKQDREFAKRENGNSEDLGKKLKSFSLDMYVLGDDYFAQRDALLEALDSEGAGTLVHPYLGTRIVQVGNYSLNETVDEGRIARFNVQFSEAGEIKFPDQVEDDIAATTDNALNLQEQAKGVFEELFSVANQAAFVINAAADGVDAIVDTLDEAVKKVREPIANLSFAIANIKASVNDLIRRPGELADILGETFDSLLDELDGDEETTNRILGQVSNSIDGAFTPVIGETPSRQREATNQSALQNLTKELVLSTRARAVVQIDFLSTEAALEAQREIVEGLDAQLNLAANDDLFQSIQDVQTSITRALPRTGTTELITITPVQTIPALVIAYDEFEDLDKETEIIEENNIDHPGFVPGGEPIQVSAG